MGTFAEALRALLDERQVSQRELARRLGLSAQAVNGWLNAGVIPTRGWTRNGPPKGAGSARV